MWNIINDIINVAYSIHRPITEITLGYELYKPFYFEYMDRNLVNQNPKDSDFYYKNIKIICDTTNQVLIQVK